MKQTTLLREVRCSGIGLHSGRKVGLVLRPAPCDTGVVFTVNTALGRERIVPRPDRVVSTGLATTLGVGDVRISTIEHLMAALVGLEVDNVYVEVNGNELPILDGSASVYVYLIRSAGIKFLDKSKFVAKVRRPVKFESNGKYVSAKPYQGLKIDYKIFFEHPKIGVQNYSFESSPASFESLIARARTFGFLKDVEWLQSNGLALGGTLENAVVFDDYGVLNPEGLRFRDEMVRHKVLDFMGDIAVGTHRLYGHFEVCCSGHELNNKFLRHIFAHADEYLEFTCLGAEPRRSRGRDFDLCPSTVPAWA